jgi:hypothetical protein
MQISTTEEAAQTRHPTGKQALYPPRGEWHREVWPRYLQWPTRLKLSRQAVLSRVHGSVGGSERVVVRRYIDALVEVLDDIVPSVRIVADLFSPQIIAATRPSLVNHLIANAAAAESFALSVKYLSAVELLVGSQCRPSSGSRLFRVYLQVEA